MTKNEGRVKSKVFLAGTLLWISCFAASMNLQAAAGFIALEGSDATALHYDPVYTPELFKYLQGASSLNVLVYNPTGLKTGLPTGGVGATYVSSIAGVDLSKYSALYIESPYGCCVADNTVLNGFGASVSAFIAAGGNLSIENYVGGTYDGVVPGGAAPAGSVLGAGIANTATYHGPSCTDGERVTAFGLLKGFTQPPVDGCWSHQGYETSYWSTFGYQSIMASATVLTDTSGSGGFTFADGTQLGSSFLAVGGTLGGGAVPEPTTVILLGCVGVFMAIRHQKMKKA